MECPTTATSVGLIRFSAGSVSFSPCGAYAGSCRSGLSVVADSGCGVGASPLVVSGAIGVDSDRLTTGVMGECSSQRQTSSRSRHAPPQGGGGGRGGGGR